MGAVADAVSDLGDSVSDAVSSVGETVSDVGQAVVNEVVEPVVKAVQNTYDAFERDPVGTTVKIAAAASGNPAYVMAANTAVEVANGADLDEALERSAEATAKYYVVKEAGKVAVEEFGTPNVDPSSAAALENKAIDAAARGATSATLSGEDPVEGAKSALVSAGVSAGSSSVSREISDKGLEDFSRAEAEKLYESTTPPTEQDVLLDPSVPMDFPLSTPTTETGPGYYNEVTGEYIPDESGALSAPLDYTSGTNLDSMKDYTYDVNTNTYTTPDGEVFDLNELSNTRAPLDTASVLPPPSEPEYKGYDPIDTKPALNYALNAILKDDPSMARPPSPTGVSPTRNQTSTESNNLLGLLALLDTKAPQAPVQNNPNDIKYFYDIMGSDILPPTVPKAEKPVFDYAEGGTIEDLIRMLRS